MVNKIKAYKEKNGVLVDSSQLEFVDAYKTTDGNIFLSELEAYKYETSYLENKKQPDKSVTISIDDIDNRILFVNGIEINGNVKQYSIPELVANSCLNIPESPGIYMWFNILEKFPYCGSANNMRNRVSSFVNPNNKTYAGKKINTVRARYENVHNFAWKLLILEIGIEEKNLLDRENFYVNKFNSINSGYNIMQPIAVKENNEISAYDKALMKYAFETFKRRVKDWNMTIGGTMSLEEYSKNYKIGEAPAGEKRNKFNPNVKYASFRLPCFFKRKNVIEVDDLIYLPMKVVQIIDNGKTGFRNKDDMFPTSMICYRAYDKSYYALCDKNTIFDNPIDAAKYRIESFRNEILSFINEIEYGDLYIFLRDCTIDTFIDLCYHDSERVKDFINGKSGETTTSIPISGILNKNSAAMIARHYEQMINNIAAFGLEVSESLSFENYVLQFPSELFGKRDNDKYPSFRLTSYLEGKSVIGVEDIVYLPYGIAKHLDKPKIWQMKNSDAGKIPDFMSFANLTKKYTAVGLCGRYYDTLKEALCAYLKLILNKFDNILDLNNPYYCCINFDIDEKLLNYIKSMNYETLLRISFKNPEPLINIINSKSNIIEAETAASMATS